MLDENKKKKKIDKYTNQIVIFCLYLHRAIIGEVDETVDSTIDLSTIRAEPIGSVVF